MQLLCALNNAGIEISQNVILLYLCVCIYIKSQMFLDLSLCLLIHSYHMILPETHKPSNSYTRG